MQIAGFMTRVRENNSDQSLSGNFGAFEMFRKQSLIHASAHMAALTTGYAPGYFLFEKAVFGLLTAWWLSLYVGFLANITVRAIAPIALIIIAALLLDVLLDLGWFYTEGASANPLIYFSVLLAYGLFIVVSPIFSQCLSATFCAKAS